MNEKTLAERCKEYREKHHLSKRGMADLCVVHVNTISNIENGKPLCGTTVKRVERVIELSDI